VSERIPIGSDHAGFDLKETLKRHLRERGLDVGDVGTDSAESTDYPDYAKKVAASVSTGESQRGILMCGTGLGMSYAANRYPNVRAAVAWTPEIARLSRNHNDSNVLVLPARFVSEETALEILDSWLDAEFEGGRHARRVSKIEREIE
jgi:ribose 5-phosphate isomerase B